MCNFVGEPTTVLIKKAYLKNGDFGWTDLEGDYAANEEIKLVSCIRGAIFDVALDLRVNSPTRGQWLSVELTEKNHQMLYIPEGIAHGFQSLVDETMVYYQMSEFYHPEAARCVSYNDAKYNIIWPIAEKIISARDMMPYE